MKAWWRILKDGWLLHLCNSRVGRVSLCPLRLFKFLSFPFTLFASFYRSSFSKKITLDDENRYEGSSIFVTLAPPLQPPPQLSSRLLLLFLSRSVPSFCLFSIKITTCKPTSSSLSITFTRKSFLQTYRIEWNNNNNVPVWSVSACPPGSRTFLAC